MRARYIYVVRRRYTVPGVIPRRVPNDPEGWDLFDGRALAATPSVIDALARAPRTFLAIVLESDEVQSWAIPRAEFCNYVTVGTRDGRSWGLSFQDAVKLVVDPDEDNLLEQAIAGQPDVVEVDHEDRESFVVRLTRVHPADEMLARFIDAITTAHREQARRRGVAIPE